MITLVDLAWLLLRINKKLNLLVENAGLKDELEAMRLELKGSTEALAAAVQANQPK